MCRKSRQTTQTRVEERRLQSRTPQPHFRTAAGSTDAMIAWHRVCTPLLLGLRLGRPPPAGRGRLLASVAEEGFVPSREAADTIFALSSGAGRAGVSVIRVSGPQARDAILELAPITTGELPPPRSAVLRSVVWPELAGAGQREVIDQALVLWFPGPRSFTGEDVVEFHTHGSRAVVTAVLEALGSLRGLRLGGSPSSQRVTTHQCGSFFLGHRHASRQTVVPPFFVPYLLKVVRSGTSYMLG